MIGRKKEIQRLKNLYNSNQAELVAVYGRRRVGKTYLVNEWDLNTMNIAEILTML